MLRVIRGFMVWLRALIDSFKEEMHWIDESCVPNIRILMIKIINQTLCLKLIHKSISISNLLNSLNVSVLFLHLLVFVNDQLLFLLLNQFLLHVVPSFLITSLIHLCLLLGVFIGRPSSKFSEIVNVLFSSFYFLIGGVR